MLVEVHVFFDIYIYIPPLLRVRHQPDSNEAQTSLSMIYLMNSEGGLKHLKKINSLRTWGQTDV